MVVVVRFLPPEVAQGWAERSGIRAGHGRCAAHRRGRRVRQAGSRRHQRAGMCAVPSGHTARLGGGGGVRERRGWKVLGGVERVGRRVRHQRWGRSAPTPNAIDARGNETKCCLVYSGGALVQFGILFSIQSVIQKFRLFHFFHVHTLVVILHPI